MIVTMKKVYIACLTEDRQALLDTLFSLGEVMIIPQENSSPANEEAAKKLQAAEKLINDIKPFEEKKSLLAGRPEVTESEFSEINAESLALEEKLSDKINELSELKEKKSETLAYISELSPWTGLKIPVEELKDTEFTSVMTGMLPQSRKAILDETINDLCEIYYFGTENGFTAALIICCAEDKEEVKEKVSTLEFALRELPIMHGLVSDEYESKLKLSKDYTKKADKLESEISELTKHSDEITVLADQYLAEYEKQSADTISTEKAVYIEGWVKAKSTDKVKVAVESVLPYAVLEFTDPAEDDKVPTATNNGYVIKQFESITNMFSVPSASELDPNPVMAPWYWIIFGMMMGDVGYGFLMLIGGLLFKKFLKPKGGIAKIVNVITFSGIPTIIFGVVYGSYFSAEWLPAIIAPLKGNNILIMLIASVGIGILHIFTSLIFKMISSIKSGDWLSPIYDQLSWMFIITGLIFLAVPGMKTVGIVMASVGAVVVLLFAGRQSKNIFARIGLGLYGLYGISGFLSDALSYTRILALAISSGIIGMVMNILAGKTLAIPVVGYLFAAIICIIGHLFNLVMGLLSAYVHDSRLQFIEFFGRFFNGCGVEFKPFTPRTCNIDIKKE